MGILDDILAAYQGIRDEAESPMPPRPRQTFAGNDDQNDPLYQAFADADAKKFLPRLITAPEHIAESLFGGAESAAQGLISGARAFGDSAKKATKGDFSFLSSPVEPEPSQGEIQKSASETLRNMIGQGALIGQQTATAPSQLQPILDKLRSQSQPDTLSFVMKGDQRVGDTLPDSTGSFSRSLPPAVSDDNDNEAIKFVREVSPALGLPPEKQKMLEMVAKFDPKFVLSVIEQKLSDIAPNQSIDKILEELQTKGRDNPLALPAAAARLRGMKISEQQIQQFLNGFDPRKRS